MVVTWVRTKLFNWLEERKVHPDFTSVDAEFQAAYRGINPYTVCRMFWGASSYGETPLSTMQEIADRCGFSEQDCVIEMGAGRGRTAFFLATVYGCRVIAYEKVPLFAQKGRELGIQKVQWREEDMFEADLSEATAIYLYGTMFSEMEVRKVAAAIQKIPRHVTIISVSEPLPGFSIEQSFEGRFPWGTTDIYIQRT